MNGSSHPSALETGVRWVARSAGRGFLVVFLISFGLRGGFLALAPAEYFLADTGWEVGSVAQSLAETGEFANPYAVPTGATAHTPPIYPFILSLIYRLLGVTVMAGYASWILTVAGSSAMFGLLPRISGTFGVPREAGVVGGLVGALLPTWPAQVETLAALTLAFLLVGFLCRWTSGATTLRGSFLFGMAGGVSFHLSPALLPVVVACIGFEVWWRSDRCQWRSASLVIAGIVFTCLPWAGRNFVIFHDFFFVRDNLGLELRVANHEGATIERTTLSHPRVSVGEARRVRELGEREYMKQARHDAVEWIRANPAAFLQLSAGRMAYFWFGPLARPTVAFPALATTLLALVGARRLLPRLTIPQRAALAIPLATYPLIYYFVNYLSRYRVTVEWILLLFAGAALWQYISAGRAASA